MVATMNVHWFYYKSLYLVCVECRCSEESEECPRKVGILTLIVVHTDCGCCGTATTGITIGGTGCAGTTIGGTGCISIATTGGGASG